MAAACIVALALIAGAVALARALPMLAQRSPMLLFWPIIGLASYLGGVGPGLLAGLLSVLACWYFVIQAPFSFGTLTGADIALILVSLTVAAVVVLIVSSLRRALAEREDLVRQLRRSEARARLLRRESQHRIANNLQTVSSLLHLQAATAEPRVQEQLFLTSKRIEALGTIHRHLEQSEDPDNGIEVVSYLDKLCGGIVSASGIKDVTCNVSSVARTLASERLAILALIVAELLTNSLKHAFPEGRAGKLRVALARTEAGGYRLTVEDDGVGLPQPLGRRGSGITIVEALAAQLGGQFRFVQVPTGTLAEVTFGEEGSAGSSDRPMFDGAADPDADRNLRTAGMGLARLVGVFR